MAFRLNPFTGEFDEIGSSGGSGSGDVVGPASATDNALVTFDGTTGKLIQNSSAIYASGVLTVPEINLTTDLEVQYGGSGRSSATAYAVICGGTTAAGAHQSIASVGTSGQVLTSNGAGALPTFQNASGGTTFDDSTFRIYDNTDNSKEIAFQASGITTATTRTITMADQDIDLTPTTGTYQGADADLTALSALSGTGMLARTGAATYSERTITGTADKITVTDGDGVSGAPTLTIASTYAGQTSIVTLGTVTTGTWNGTTIDVANGGTGGTSHTAYAVLCGGTTSGGALQSIASVGTSGQVLTSNGAGALPTFQAAGGGSLPPKEWFFSAKALAPVESNAAVLTQLTGTNSTILVRAFDDTTEEYANGEIQVPGDVDTTGTVTFRAYVSAATAAGSSNVGLTLGHVALNNSDNWDVAYTEEDSGAFAIDATQDDVTEATWTETITNLGWAANDLVYIRLSRDVGVSSNLSGDMYLHSLTIEIPRA